MEEQPLYLDLYLELKPQYSLPFGGDSFVIFALAFQMGARLTTNLLPSTSLVLFATASDSALIVSLVDLASTIVVCVWLAVLWYVVTSTIGVGSVLLLRCMAVVVVETLSGTRRCVSTPVVIVACQLWAAATTRSLVVAATRLSAASVAGL